MRKIMVIMLCCCFVFTSFSFALSTKAFSIDLPDEFYLESEEENSAVYTNGKMKISYMFEKSEFGEYFMDVTEMQDDYSKMFILALMGFGSDSKVEKINGVNFLTNINVSDYSSETSMNYLGTTSSYLVKLSFSGENLDEQLVLDTISSIKLKGISSGFFDFLMEYGFILLVVIICGISWLLKARKKARQLEKEFNQKNEQYEASEQDNYQNPIQNYTDPISQKKNDWNL